MRLFIGIPLPEGTKREINGVVNQLKDCHLPIKWEKEEKWHVTLKFLGEVKDNEISNLKSPACRQAGQISKSISAINPFFLKLEKVGYFYKRHLVVWVSVGGQVDTLKKLHRQLEENLAEIGFPKEQREFKGHITIGRGKKLSNQQLKELQEAIFDLKLPKFSEFKVKQINLYQSILKPEGSEYLIIEEFILGK